MRNQMTFLIALAAALTGSVAAAQPPFRPAPQAAQPPIWPGHSTPARLGDWS